ncbi:MULTISPECIES: efflux RND transporter periplasmic adaptor subunit [unclassified Janthinobacterium]|uniref:efflux RND transporter periplasmic adaptor subunit n=1 Tax=unclassified Janthinobacterium TaxID=2610881 RepID=UPI00160F596B|nr:MULTISPECIES: efflux RND transporter periplasmic adaptor subunit [unclassified Janthinobacterium]MBB5607972.1 RND family efflux transporter MFP subunit [Janthinobacterium sp. S3T4]MBB5613287.1 RND family efflux transporter MFP subunit [Janthinobacterium sp. S3M3]
MKKLTLKPIAIVLAALVIVAGAGFTLYTPASRATDSKESAQKPALTVTSAKPQPASLPIKLSANGNVAAWQEAVIGSESNGLRLTEVRVNVGDVVRAGQVLAVFSNDTVNADLAQAKAAVQEAQANAAEAAANAQRARSLQSTGAISAQQITQYLTAEQTANARIASSKAQLATQELRLKYTQVVAPDSGIISSRSATVGSVVGAGTELFRLIRQGRLEWRAEVTATELLKLTPGTLAEVTAANGSALTGKVRMIAPTVDPQSRTALVYVDLPASTGANAPFKAGMYASGTFALGASNALTVPQQAIAIRDGFSYVFRLKADQRVSQIKVEPGRRLADSIEILSGITADTTIVVNGAGFLNDGDLVRNVTLPVASAKK